MSKHKNNPFRNPESIAEDTENQEIQDSAQEQKQDEVKTENSTKLNELQEKYDTLNQQYIRLAADFDNFRKRTQSEREELLKYGTENALKKLVEVLDNFERGKKALENIDDCEKIKESFDLVHKQVIDILTKLGLEEIETEGKEFDPNFHEAVMQTPNTDFPENTIINELQKGYKFNDKVLRASLVNVSAGTDT